jgi:hypothetical protein
MVGKLSTKERYVLFALDNEHGYIINNNTVYWIGLAGSVIFEMMEQGLLSIENETLICHSTDSDIICYQKVFNILAKYNTPPKVETVLLDLWDKTKEMHQEIVDLLIAKGILKEVKWTRFWFIQLKRYPTLNKIPELGLRKYMLLLVMKDRIPNRESYLLFRMIYHCDLISEVFGKENDSMVLDYIEKLQDLNEKTGEISEPIKSLETALLSAIFNKNLQLILDDE